VADVSDVENVLVSALTQAIYPNGTGNPSVIGSLVRIPYRGWPVPADLDADLKNGMVNVTVFPQDNDKRTTKYPQKWYTLPFTEPRLELIVAGNTITVAGIPSSPLNAAAIVNRVAYVYPVQLSDTLVSIATGLAALINVNTPATSDGAVISIDDAIPQNSPVELSISESLSRRFGGSILGSMAAYWPFSKVNLGLSGFWRKRFGGVIESSMAAYFPTPSAHLAARVGAVVPIVREIKRQKRGFQITFWCPTPAVRDAIVPPCDLALASTDFLTLPDGTAGRLLYERSAISDRAEKQGLYRRDLFYSVEYGTTQSGSAAQIVAQIFSISGGLDPKAPLIEKFSL
jgi:hypothetical protein